MTGAVNFEPHFIAVESQGPKRVGQKLLVRSIGDSIRPVGSRERPIGIGVFRQVFGILDITQNCDEFDSGELKILRIGVFFELNMELLN